jgi:hypothetical protein
MRNVALVLVLLIAVFGASSSVWAYEGGTKAVAAMGSAHKEGQAQFGPISVVPSHWLTPGKLIERYLHRIPEPTLTAERLREETPGPSLGTKEVTRFWKR